MTALCQTALCETCHEEYAVGDWPFCPHGPMRHFTVVPDDIPGGQVIENLTREPQRYYSRSAIKRQMEALGVEAKVEHKGTPGSDKSPHTTRWI